MYTCISRMPCTYLCMCMYVIFVMYIVFTIITVPTKLANDIILITFQCNYSTSLLSQ